MSLIARKSSSVEFLRTTGDALAIQYLALGTWHSVLGKLSFNRHEFFPVGKCQEIAAYPQYV